MNEVLQIVITTYYAPFFRALGLVLLLPLGETILSSIITRVSMAMGITLLIGESIGSPPEGIVPLIIARELIVGALIALPTALIVSGAGMIGDLFDTGRGQNMATLLDPLHETQELATAVLMKNLIFAELLLIGVLERLVAIFSESFSVIKSGGAVFGTEHSAEVVLSFISRFSSEMFLLYMPWALLFLLIEVSIGFISKVLPSVSLSSESFQIKSYLGLFLLAIWYSPESIRSLFFYSVRPASLLLSGAGG